MAHKKASKYDILQSNAQHEAIAKVKDFCKRQGLTIEPKSFYVKWFAFLNNGYRCQITSLTKGDIFFEISVNKTSGESIITQFYRMAYSVKPSTKGEVIDMRCFTGNTSRLI